MSTKLSFWADPTTEPKRNFRFILNMNGIPQWIIKSVNLPKMEIGEATHWYINHPFYYPGRLEYNEINITLVDPVNPDSARTLLEKMHSSGYVFPLNANNTATISKARAVSALGNVSIKQLGPDEGQVVAEWHLVNSWIKSVDYGGELSYESDDLTELTLTIRYDYAQMPRSGPWEKVA